VRQNQTYEDNKDWLVVNGRPETQLLVDDNEAFRV
jgi:hypothetical protein